MFMYVGQIFRVPADMPLYDILNEFQKGSSHMAAVVRTKGKNKADLLPVVDGGEAKQNKANGRGSELTTPLLSKQAENSENVVIDVDRDSWLNNVNKETSLQQKDATTNALSCLSEDTEDGEVIGIITLEDVFEELLQVDYEHFDCSLCTLWIVKSRFFS